MHSAAWSPGLLLRFWGARGGLPAPGPDTLRYGGNTACVEVRCNGHLLILDAGSGLRCLGDALVQEEQETVAAEVLCSHTHLDHICGLPFFAPLYQTGTRLRIWGGKAGAPETLEAVLGATLSGPLMPDLLPRVHAQIDFLEFRPGDILAPWPGLRVSTAPLHHPGSAVGYRLEWGGKIVAYLTDTEHDPAAQDADVLRLAKDADILIYDATYTDEEFPRYKGWGHSTWQEAVRLADAAGAKRLVLFHHAPSRTDADLDRIEAEAAARRPGTLAAREGMQLSA
ncbi:MAG: MBL fold metallo-hydrolase [Acetobacteraceae bacterium]|nr:MBL fold metallo-hydrolase [Acetobacteraceae bacterium]